MRSKNREMLASLSQNGHRKTAESLTEKKVDSIVTGAPALVNFPCLNDMIRMKKAAGRAKDMEDLWYLKKLKSQKN